MAWIELHQNLLNHIKLKKLARDVGVEDRDIVRAKLENLWLWCLDYRENGTLTGMDDQDIADASNWNGDATKWVSSLVARGWLDKKRGGKKGSTLKIHDWWDFAGRLINQRVKNRERMRRARAPHEPDTSGATLPDQTLPDQTKPNQEEVPASSPKSGGVDEEIASKYRQMNPGMMSQANATLDIARRRRLGMNAETALIRVMDPKICRDQKLWDVLGPITPNGKQVPETMSELRRRTGPPVNPETGEPYDASA